MQKSITLNDKEYRFSDADIMALELLENSKNFKDVDKIINFIKGRLENTIEKSRKISHKLSFLDNVCNYYEYVNELCTKCNYATAKRYVTKKEFKINNADSEIFKNLLNELSDKFVNGTDYELYVDEYIKKSERYKDEICSLKEKQNKFQDLWILFKGVVADVIQNTDAAKKGITTILANIRKVCSEHLKAFKEFIADAEKMFGAIDNSITQYQSMYIRQKQTEKTLKELKGLKTLKDILYNEYESESSAFETHLVSDAIETDEVQNYIATLSPLCLEDITANEPEKALPLDIIQKHIDDFTSNIFYIGDDNNVLEIKAIGYSNELQYEEDAAYSGEYIVFNIAVIDKYELPVHNNSKMKNHDRIWVRYDDKFNYNYVKAVAEWLDIYALYNNVNELNNIFEKYRKNGWIDFRVYFLLDLGIDTAPENTKGKEIKPSLTAEEYTVNKLQSLCKDDTSIDFIKNHMNQIIQFIQEGIEAEFNSANINFVNLGNIVDDKALDVALQRIKFVKNTVQITISLAELYNIIDKMYLLKKITDTSTISDELYKFIGTNNHYNDTELEELNCFLNKELSAVKVFKDYFQYKFKESVLGILEPNIITNVIGIASKIKPKRLLSSISKDGDFLDCIKGIDYSEKGHLSAKKDISNYIEHIHKGQYYFDVVIKKGKYWSEYMDEETKLDTSYYDDISIISAIAEGYESYRNDIHFAGRLYIVGKNKFEKINAKRIMKDFISYIDNDGNELYIYMPEVPVIYGTALNTLSSVEIQETTRKSLTEKVNPYTPITSIYDEYNETIKLLSIIKLLILAK